MKIVYSINGQGRGHVTRSWPLIKELMKKHDVYVYAGGNAYDFLHDKVKIKKIPYFKLIYYNNKIAYLITLLNYIGTLPSMRKELKIFEEEMKYLNPDLIISDFEPLALKASRKLKIRSIILSNQEEILEKESLFRINPIFWPAYFIFLIAMKLDFRGGNIKLVTSIDRKNTINRKNIIFIDPLVREDIKKLKTSYKDYFFVYATDKNNIKILDLLEKTNKKAVAYGFNEKIAEKYKNIKLKSSEKNLFSDIANCSVVITSGGHSLISEAIILKKPILSIPIRNQFEQIFNAITVKKLGIGDYILKPNKEKIENFMKNIEKYRKTYQGINVKNSDIKEIVKLIEKSMRL